MCRPISNGNDIFHLNPRLTELVLFCQNIVVTDQRWTNLEETAQIYVQHITVITKLITHKK